MSLDTLANVKTRIGITGSTDDSLTSLLMSSADAWVGNYTGRDFVGGTYTEYFPGNVEFLQLANFPVISVTSVKVDPAGAFGSDTVVATTVYVVHSERGVIQSKVGPFVVVPRSPGLVNDDRADWKRSPRSVQVVYATATGAVPNDVLQAYAMLIAYWYRQVKTQTATNFQPVSQQRYGDVLLEYRLDKLLTLPPPEDVQRLLAPYRTPNL
jgi:hypothetical protein